MGSSVGSGVGCPWAAHGKFAMQIRLPTTSIYGNSVQLSGQPTTSNMKKLVAQEEVECAAHGLHVGSMYANEAAHYSGNGEQLSGQLSGWQPTTFKYGNSGQLSGHPT